LFLAAYRLFLQILLNWIDAAIDTAASVDSSRMATRNARTLAHAVYIGISRLFVALALFKYDRAHSTKLAFIFGSVALADFATIAAEMTGASESVTPARIMASVHGAFAGMALFLLRSGTGPETEDRQK
jgi:hypothetical protein